MVLFYTIASVLIISALSLVGIFTLSLNVNRLNRLIHYLVSFAVGTLLGGSFLHLLPEIISASGKFSTFTALHVPFGILIFFSLEKFVRWRHCHEINCEEHSKHLVPMNLLGDGLHNFMDGLIIGASYLVSIPVGVATTIAIAFHELPQEMGDFGVLVHGGFKKTKALQYNFLISLLAVAGAVIAVLVGPRIYMFIDALIPITAGGFIYIACSDLIPELHRKDKAIESIIQIVFIILGLAVMWALKVLI